jgi:hypothetical protein
MAVLFLEQIDGFEVAIQIGPDVIPGIARIMNVLISPEVRQRHFTRIGIHFGECVE